MDKAIQKPKHAGGRPRILKSIEQAGKLIDEYFEKNPDRPTICGLALFLGFVDRQSLRDYLDRKDDEFSCIIKRAYARIEAKHEERMYSGQPAGSIFWLKNKNWRDTQDLNVSGSLATRELSKAELVELLREQTVPCDDAIAK